MPPRKALIVAALLAVIGGGSAYALLARRGDSAVHLDQAGPAEGGDALPELLPTVVVPPALEGTLAEAVLRVENAGISGREETSMGEVERRSGPDLIALRKAVVDVALEEVNAVVSRGRPASEALAALRTRLQREFDSAEKAFCEAVGSAHCPRFYAPFQLASLRLADLPGHPELLELRLAAPVPCGFDESAHYFQRRGASYRSVLNVMNEDPKHPGFEGLDVKVSPLDGAGRFFVVKANGMPWCTSCWGGLNVEVYRPGSDPDRPKRVLRLEKSMRRCADRSLSATAQGFSLRYSTWQGLDGDLLVRDAVLNYQVGSDSAERVEPWAEKPEDFLDEWVQMSREDAARFVAGPDAAPTLRWRERLGLKEQVTHFDFVQACPTAGRWQIGLTLESEGKPTRYAYVDIEAQGPGFRVLSISDTRSSGCPGNSPPIQGGGSE